MLQKLCGGEIFHTRRKKISTRHSEVRAVRATLGMPGFPQSGTGQTALFAGVNGAKIFGRHFGPYPPAMLRKVLDEKNIFLDFINIGRTVAFANAFPQRYFDHIASGTRLISVLSYSCLASNVPLFTAKELAKNKALSADLLRERWHELGHTGIPRIDPFEAGKHLASIATQYDLTIFEYFHTDRAGHSRDMEMAKLVLTRFDAFLGGFLEHYDLSASLFLLISDHGNIEDLSTKTHTRNDVPCILCGVGRKRLAKQIRSLVDVTPALLKLYTKH